MTMNIHEKNTLYPLSDVQVDNELEELWLFAANIGYFSDDKYYISFTSLLLALLYTDDPNAKYIQEYLGAKKDRIIKNLVLNQKTSFSNLELAKARTPGTRQLSGKELWTQSAENLFSIAVDFASQTNSKDLCVRHILGAYIYGDISSLHKKQLLNLGIVQESLSNSFLEMIRDTSLYQFELDFWKGLHEKSFEAISHKTSLNSTNIKTDEENPLLFSDVCNRILNIAENLGPQSKNSRNNITSTCLFFAITEFPISSSNKKNQNEVQSISTFADLIKSTGGNEYDVIRTAYFPKGATFIDQKKSEKNQKKSANVETIIEKAKHYTSNVFTGKVVKSEYLIAAFLMVKGTHAHVRLKDEIGVDLDDLRPKFRDAMIETYPKQKKIWEKIFGKKEVEIAPNPAIEEKIVYLDGGIVTASADIPAEEDHLGRKPLVDTLANMLASPDQSLPMTIALLGDWGAGKSSVIEQLKKELNRLSKQSTKNSYLFADFNAWEYEQLKNIRAGLAQEVVNALTEGLTVKEKFILAIKKAHKENFWEFWQSVGGLIFTAIGIAVGLFIAVPDANSTTEGLKMIGGGGILAAFSYLFHNMWKSGKRLLEHPMASQLKTYLQLPNYGKHLGEISVIKNEIKSLCEERLKNIKNGRMLVLVDDLDRCHPNAITETLDAIRLVMNLPNVAVILAIDDRIAFRAVAEHYKALAKDGKRSEEEIARDYLGKIIQLPINLYDPWPWEISRFVKDYLFTVEDNNNTQSQNESVNQDKRANNNASEIVKDLSPAAKTLLEGKEVPLHEIVGSGKDGCILKKDVENYLKSKSQDSHVAEIEKVSMPPADNNSDKNDFDELPPTAKEIDESKENDALMKDTAIERDLFAEITKEMNFGNPRQLIRLKNSYRLLKGYRHSRKKGELDIKVMKELMHGLFWYEYLYQQKLERRQHAELVVWEWPSKEAVWEKEAGAKEVNPPFVNMARRLSKQFSGKNWDIEYKRLMHTVGMVVLPNAQTGLILSRQEADAVFKKILPKNQSTINPWSF